MRRNFWLALSFANLAYLRAWADLLPLSPDFLFHRKRLPGMELYCAIATDVLVLSLLTFLLLRLAPKMPAWLQRILLVAAAAMVGLALRAVAPAAVRHSPLFSSSVAVVLLILVAAFVLGFFALAVRAAQWAALAATPCIAVTFVGSLFYLGFQSPLPPDPPLASSLPGRPPARVLWIVFDEWDQRLTFRDRAPGILMPTLDRLVDNSFSATRALAVLSETPLSEMATVDAIPSLLYGRLAVRSETQDAAVRKIGFEGGGSTTFGRGDSIFARFHSRGWNSAVAGWYLPYCRVFAQLLTDCYWDEMYEQRSSSSGSFPAAAVDEARMLFETRMFSVFGPSLANTRHFAEYEALMAAARRYAADPSIGLAFIHFNVPHVPYFYNPKVGRFGHYGFSDARYNDALEWVDRSVGAVLSALNGAGLDSKTAIILSSDHPLRTAASSAPYVPFIVHLPGEAGGVVSTEEFSTVKTADMALAIAGGEVKSPSDVMAFLK